jgi:hypothetical protein
MQFPRKPGDVVRLMTEARNHSYRRPALENFTMKAAILAVAAAAGLALTAGSASAHPPGGYYGGHHHGGGYYGGGYYAPRPVLVQPYLVAPVYRPVYPAYGYGYSPYRPGLNITIGSGYGYPYGGGFYRW